MRCQFDDCGLLVPEISTFYRKEEKKMESPHIVIRFEGGSTIKETYEMHVKSYLQAVALAAGDPGRLREFELDALEVLATIRRLQSQDRGI